jgi:hypothetical protein
MWSLIPSLALLVGSVQASASAADAEAVLRHSAGRGRPLAGLHQAIQRNTQSLSSQRYVAARGRSQRADQTSDGTQHPFSALKKKYEAHCFPQRISHFDPSVNGTFCQRYWIDASSYKEGGPVYVLDGGETSGANR